MSKNNCDGWPLSRNEKAQHTAYDSGILGILYVYVGCRSLSMYTTVREERTLNRFRWSVSYDKTRRCAATR